MRVLVTSLLASIPGLANVVVLFSFVFLIFGILGVQLWAGLTHFKCRVTPFPLYQNTTLCNANGYKCYSLEPPVNISNFPVCIPGVSVYHDRSSEDYIDEITTMDRTQSPWKTPQACEWPLSARHTRICSAVGAGRFSCPRYDINGVELNLYCGSNYDFWGNARFEDERIMNVNYMEENAWGFTKFDHIGYAFITIFQTITLERWVDIMYLVSLCSSPFFFSF